MRLLSIWSRCWPAVPTTADDVTHETVALMHNTFYSIGHGSNDAQKTMGIIWLLLIAAGAIIGVGSTRRVRAVRWGVAGNVVIAWILTIPASALMAAAAWWLGRRLF